ncbi:MAG: GAF domain-containing protein, partial [Anaerolineae bacterium]
EELQRGLEEKVAEQTALLSRRVAQLEAAAQVAREAAIHEDVRTLLDNVTHLISERFDFYHTGIFLLDERGEYAVLQAASSEGGQRMLQRGHRLKVGEQGIVGLVAAQRRPHIALDVGEDAVFFNNPDLPLTRSEMALPLIFGGNVIGVLDIQSTQPAAFTQDDVQILQTLADQLAVAIENARLLNESQIVVQQLQAIAGEQTRQAWLRWARRKQRGYLYTPLGIEPLENGEKPESPSDDPRRLELPITLRGQTIGTITLQRKKAQPPWTEKDRALASEIVSQASLALESARLLEETQRRAQEEQLVREVATHIHATLDLDTVLRTATREIYRALDLEMAEVRLNIPEEEKEKGNGSHQ